MTPARTTWRRETVGDKPTKMGRRCGVAPHFLDRLRCGVSAGSLSQRTERPLIPNTNIYKTRGRDPKRSTPQSRTVASVRGSRKRWLRPTTPSEPAALTICAAIQNPHVARTSIPPVSRYGQAATAMVA